MCNRQPPTVICLSASQNVISVWGVGVAICLSLCAGCRAFLHCAAFFWQLSSLDLDSISLDGRSSGFSRRRSLSSASTSAHTAAALLCPAKTSAKVTVNEIRKYGCPLTADGPCAQQQVKFLSFFFSPVKFENLWSQKAAQTREKLIYFAMLTLTLAKPCTFGYWISFLSFHFFFFLNSFKLDVKVLEISVRHLNTKATDLDSKFQVEQRFS